MRVRKSKNQFNFIHVISSSLVSIVHKKQFNFQLVRKKQLARKKQLNISIAHKKQLNSQFVRKKQFARKKQLNSQFVRKKQFARKKQFNHLIIQKKLLNNSIFLKERFCSIISIALKKQFNLFHIHVDSIK